MAMKEKSDDKVQGVWKDEGITPQRDFFDQRAGVWTISPSTTP
jgi:hypothetical protein